MGEAQGKKVDPTPLRSGDRGAAVLRPDQAKERSCGSRAEQHPREKTWAMSNALHKRPGISGEEKKPWRTERTVSRPDQSGLTLALPRERVSVGLEAVPPGVASDTGTAVFRLMRTSGQRPDIQPDDEGAQAQLPLDPSARGSDAGPPPTLRSALGGTKSVIRAQAAPPTRIAPTIAKASRQTSDGKPMCVSPSVA